MKRLPIPINQRYKYYNCSNLNHCVFLSMVSRILRPLLPGIVVLLPAIFSIVSAQPDSTSFSDVSITACDSFLFDGMYLTQSGIYERAFTDVNGDDSLVRLNLTLGTTFHPHVAQIGGLLSTDIPGNYIIQWLNCDSNYALLPYASKIITPPHEGYYASVAIDSLTGCRDTSGCFFYQKGTGVDNAGLKELDLRIYPNPSKGQFQLEGQIPEGGYHMVIRNILGQKIMDTKLDHDTREIQLPPSAENGTYLIEIRTDSGIFRSTIQLLR